jgi:molybdenum cofactor cytidylyltransferase
VARVLTAPPGQAVSAELDGAPLPPALFPAALFARLEALSGDRGAGAVLRALPGRIAVPVPPAHLRDIDLRSDLGGMG